MDVRLALSMGLARFEDPMVAFNLETMRRMGSSSSDTGQKVKSKKKVKRVKAKMAKESRRVNREK